MQTVGINFSSPLEDFIYLTNVSTRTGYCGQLSAVVSWEAEMSTGMESLIF